MNTVSSYFYIPITSDTATINNLYFTTYHCDQLKNQINTLTTNNNNLQTQINNTNSSITSLSNYAISINSKVDSNYNTLDNKINNLNNTFTLTNLYSISGSIQNLYSDTIKPTQIIMTNLFIPYYCF